MSSAPMVPPIRWATISRVERFCAAHRLHSSQLSDAENALVFGKCNNPDFHGHNYRIQVYVRGPICPRTGMVANLVDLRACIETALLSHVDHRNLDRQVPYFANATSTTENLAHFAFHQLKNALTDYVKPVVAGYPPPTLVKVVIWETDHNCVEYYEDGE